MQLERPVKATDKRYLLWGYDPRRVFGAGKKSIHGRSKTTHMSGRGGKAEQSFTAPEDKGIAHKARRKPAEKAPFWPGSGGA